MSKRKGIEQLINRLNKKNLYEIYHKNRFIHNLYRMDKFQYTHISNYLDKSTVWHSFYGHFFRFHLRGSFVTKTMIFRIDASLIAEREI